MKLTIDQKSINKFINFLIGNKKAKLQHNKLILPSPQVRGIEFKTQLNSKQSFKKFYSNNYFSKCNKSDINWKSNILKESYLRNICKMNKNSTINILSFMETRFDVIVFRLGWAKSLNEAQHLIKTKIITINSYSTESSRSYHKLFLPVGSIIECKKEKLKKNIINSSKNSNYLLVKDLNSELVQVTLMRYPSENEVFKSWINNSSNNDLLQKFLMLNMMIQKDKLNLKLKSYSN